MANVLANIAEFRSSMSIVQWLMYWLTLQHSDPVCPLFSDWCTGWHCSIQTQYVQWLMYWLTLQHSDPVCPLFSDWCTGWHCSIQIQYVQWLMYWLTLQHSDLVCPLFSGWCTGWHCSIQIQYVHYSVTDVLANIAEFRSSMSIVQWLMYWLTLQNSDPVCPLFSGWCTG